jgi:hypothetical protein
MFHSAREASRNDADGVDGGWRRSGFDWVKQYIVSGRVRGRAVAWSIARRCGIGRTRNHVDWHRVGLANEKIR